VSQKKHPRRFQL